MVPDSWDILQNSLRDLGSLCVLCDSMKIEEQSQSARRSVAERAEDIRSLSDVLYQVVLSPLDMSS